MKISHVAFVLGSCITLLGCGGGAREGGASERRSAEAHADQGGHAVASAVPGSYEDWCTEHGVPESACTRCDPGLIPAFKATQDWCEEHGLPESQCKACNPSLVITRPPKPDGK